MKSFVHFIQFFKCSSLCKWTPQYIQILCYIINKYICKKKTTLKIDNMHGVQDLLFPNMKYHYHGQDGNYNYKITSDSYVIVKKKRTKILLMSTQLQSSISRHKKSLHYYITTLLYKRQWNITTWLTSCVAVFGVFLTSM